MSAITHTSKQWWTKLTGDAAEFSMENRAFNYVSLISFALLLCSLIIDLFIKQTIMTFVIVILFFILGGCYYLSRYKKNYNAGVIIYAVCSYAALILNFFQNSGSYGPTLCLFFVTFTFFITFAKPRQYTTWLSLQILVVIVLVVIEYRHPELIPNTYPSRLARYADMIWTYILSITIVFAVTKYLRNYYNDARLLAEERAQAIEEKNKLIVAQNLLLQRLNDEKNKILSIVSHDISGPINSITGYLRLLSDGAIEAHEKPNIEAELFDQTKYASDLLLNLMAWAKAQLQGVSVHLAAVNIKDIAEEVTNNKMSVAAKKGIKITHSIDRTIEVAADKDMLRIVLRNLVNNAIKFTKPGGDVFIKVSEKGPHAEISICDTGIGIPPEKQQEIFTMKTRSTFGTENEKGMGLGLIMCKEFIEYQHGDIRFESKEGVGSVFYITLPLVKA